MGARVFAERVVDDAGLFIKERAKTAFPCKYFRLLSAKNISSMDGRLLTEHPVGRQSPLRHHFTALPCGGQAVQTGGRTGLVAAGADDSGLVGGDEYGTTATCMSQIAISGQRGFFSSFQ